MHNEARVAIWSLTAFLILQVILVVFYQNYGARYVGDFPLFPATWNNPKKMSVFTYVQIGWTTILLVSFLVSHYFNKLAFKVFRIILIVLFVFGLLTTNGIALVSLFAIGVVNRVIKTI